MILKPDEWPFIPSSGPLSMTAGTAAILLPTAEAGSLAGLPDGVRSHAETSSALNSSVRVFLQKQLNRIGGHATVSVEPMSRTHEDIQDELLVLQCQEGDSEAMKALIARWHPRLGRLAWRLTAERDAAQDIVQDAWLGIVRGLRRLDDPARFRSWAYRIVTNKCADWTRRRVVQRRAAEDLRAAAAPGSGSSSNGADSPDAVDQIREALAKLPSEQRVMVSLHYLDGMGVAEIARTLDVPEGTVKSRLYHARSRLKQVLERMET